MNVRLSTRWQKSSYSADNNNCLELAATPDGRIHLRESDEPAIFLTSTRVRVRALLARARLSG
jgi:hypothetical protein